MGVPPCDAYVRLIGVQPSVGFLGPAQVREELRKGLIQSHKPAKDASASWDLDLRLGPEAFVSSSKEARKLQPGDTVTIEAGEFALLLTEEILQLPDDVAGFISLKFDQKKRGLTNISGFHVDPGYHGRLIFSVYNAGPQPIPLRRGDKVFMMTLARLESPAPRTGQKTTFDSIPSSLMAAVMGPPVSVLSLARRMEATEAALTKRIDESDRSLAELKARRSEGRRLAIEVGLVLLAAALSAILTWAFTKSKGA